MKNRYITLGLFALFAFLIVQARNSISSVSSFQIETSKKDVSTQKTSKKMCVDCTNSTVSTLEAKLVHEMVTGYKNNQLDHINKAEPGLDDSYSVWFDLNTLKEFICQVETDAANHKVSSNDLGLRIYYGRYPETHTWNREYKTDLSNLLGDPITRKYEKHHTVIMIPTIRKSGGNFDFNPLDQATYDTGIGGNPNYGPTSNGQVNALLLRDLKTGARNHGSLVPPHTEVGLGF